MRVVSRRPAILGALCASLAMIAVGADDAEDVIRQAFGARVSARPADDQILTYDAATGRWGAEDSAGGSTDTLAATLTAGNTTGGTDLSVTTGDSILGAAELTLTAAGGDLVLGASAGGGEVYAQGSGGAGSAEFGDGANASSSTATAMGASATATTTDCSAYGNGADATVAQGLAVGQNSSASTGTGACAVGTDATASGSVQGCSAFGTSSSASAQNASALGFYAAASGVNTISVGTLSDATGTGSLAFGTIAQSVHDYAITVGVNCASTATNQLRFGDAGTEYLEDLTIVVTSGGAYWQRLAVTATLSDLSVDAIADGLAPGGARNVLVVVDVTSPITTSGATNTYSVGDGVVIDLWGSGIATSTDTVLSDYTVTGEYSTGSAAVDVVLTPPGAETFTSGAVTITVMYEMLTSTGG